MKIFQLLNLPAIRIQSVEEGACGYDDDDDEQQWPNEAEMVAEVRQRVSNMAGVTNEEVRIVASSYRICPLGAHIDQQKCLPQCLLVTD
ncbi:galacturonokinase-like isoform X3 [Arachis stenosperma]|uniref:galacturonokinase-like isoform X3 n=1 Tax=Arachis stenosperma TaxID=217475 RepID=UPI0025AC5084|nr:galacturonokinase-like isoform X3 [Arachis stenosperma]